MKIYERIYALVLVLAMSILLCSCAATGSENTAAVVEEAVVTAESQPENEPQPVVEDIKLMFYTTELSEFTLKVGETVQLYAEIDGVDDAQFEWKCSDESSLTIEHESDDKRDAWITAEKAGEGGITLTISCGGIEEDFTVYIHNE